MKTIDENMSSPQGLTSSMEESAPQILGMEGQNQFVMTQHIEDTCRMTAATFDMGSRLVTEARQRTGNSGN